MIILYRFNHFWSITWVKLKMNGVSEYNSKFQVKMLSRTWDIWNSLTHCWTNRILHNFLEAFIFKMTHVLFNCTKLYVCLYISYIYIYSCYTKCELKYISSHAYRTLLISFILFVHVSTSWFVFTNCNRRLKLFSNLAPACNTYTINKRIYWPINWLVTVVSNSSICYAAFCWYKYRPEYSTL